MAIGFVLCSLPVCRARLLGPRDLANGSAQRRREYTISPTIGIAGTLVSRLGEAGAGADGGGGVLIGLFLEPVLGPTGTSWFARMGRRTATVTPLALVCVGLVVHALRERLPVYAFAVGQGGNVLASLLLRSGHRHEPIAEWWLPLVQANAIAFALAALLWLTARRRLYGERGHGLLMTVQVALGVVANLVCLAVVVVSLAGDAGFDLAGGHARRSA